MSCAGLSVGWTTAQHIHIAVSNRRHSHSVSVCQCRHVSDFSTSCHTVFPELPLPWYCCVLQSSGFVFFMRQCSSSSALPMSDFHFCLSIEIIITLVIIIFFVSVTNCYVTWTEDTDDSDQKPGYGVYVPKYLGYMGISRTRIYLGFWIHQRPRITRILMCI